jgi:DNA-binding FadR family transcriptional regulator
VPANIRERSDAEARAIHASFYDAITSGRLNPGDRLPNEKALCATYSASRHTVRKAMAELEQQGLIERTVGRGSFVRSRIPNDANESARAGTAPRTWSLLELTEARLVIEPHLVTLIIERADDADLADIEARIEAIVEASDWPSFKEAKYAFHRAVIAAAKNRFLLFMFDEIIASRRATAWSRHHSANVSVAATRAVCLNESKAILTALRRRDPVALEKALRAALARILAAINEL